MTFLSDTGIGSGRRRGFALVLVLVIVGILFVLGVAVAGLSVNNGRLVATMQDTAACRQAALAGLAEAQAVLNQSSDWTDNMTEFQTPPVERALPNSQPPAFYTIQFTAPPQSAQASVRTIGYLKAPNGARRCGVSMDVRLQRSSAAFLYPFQAADSISLSTGSQVSSAGEVAVRTNATLPGHVAIDGTSSVTGDIMVGPINDVSGIVSASSAVTVEAAASRAQLAAIIAPSLPAGVLTKTRSNDTNAPQPGGPDAQTQGPATDSGLPGRRPEGGP